MNIFWGNSIESNADVSPVLFTCCIHEVGEAICQATESEMVLNAFQHFIKDTGKHIENMNNDKQTAVRSANKTMEAIPNI